MSLKKDAKLEAEDLEKVNGGMCIIETEKKSLEKTEEQILLQKVQLGQTKLFEGNGNDQQEKLKSVKEFRGLQ